MRHGSSSSSDLVFVVAITELSNELVIDHSAADAKLHRIVPTSGSHLPERLGVALSACLAVVVAAVAFAERMLVAAPT